jgi:dCTP deaminase
MLLTYDELLPLLGTVVIGASPEQVNGASIDVRISGKIMRETGPGYAGDHVRVATEAIRTHVVEHPNDGRIRVQPGEFLLASTIETFNMPSDLCALFVMKSRCARNGLDQMNATLCNPGWHGSSLTLELMNVTRFHVLWLDVGMAIGQMVFFRGTEVPPEALYAARGNFNRQPGVAGAAVTPHHQV